MNGWCRGWRESGDLPKKEEFAFSHSCFSHLVILIFRFSVTSSSYFPSFTASESCSHSHYYRHPMTFAANVANLTVHTLSDRCQTCQNPHYQPTATTTLEDILLEFRVQKSPHICTVPHSIPRTMYGLFSSFFLLHRALLHLQCLLLS